MMGGGMMGGMGVWMLLWVLVGIAVLALAVVGIVALARRTGNLRSGQTSGEELPEDLLRRRYAAGEIEEEEYLRRRSGLSQQ
ncbi:MAG: SHOCT domain-containing protein [Ornithinimicrobium sp.]